MFSKSASARYVWADLVRNPRRTLSTMVGVTLGVGLSCAVLFFVDGLSASMTQRAVAPLALDMQQVLVEPVAGDLRLHQGVEPVGRLEAGQVAHLRLELVNRGTVGANEVVVRAVPPPELAYVAGSAQVDGEPVGPGSSSPFAAGAAGSGLNLGSVTAGVSRVLTFDLRATTAIEIVANSVSSTVSSRESLTPVEADAAGPTNVAQLAGEIAAVDGVAFAEPLSSADLSPGSLTAGSQGQGGRVRVFAFEPTYTELDPTIEVVDGAMAPGAALISAEASSALTAGIGDTVTVALPDGTTRDTEVSGIIDLSRARALFSSRQGADLETFVYVPTSIVLDPATFEEIVVPAFQRAATRRDGGVINAPVHEVDVGVERDLLAADPGTALVQTQRIAESVSALAGSQDYLLDNISNTLSVARADAGVAKRLFIFLGVPGGVLAAILAGYAGSVLAGAQRREQATLRIRGASRRYLLGTLALRVAGIAVVGSTIGVTLGYVSAAAVVGHDTLLRATTASLVVSGILGTVGGLLATGTALYVTGRRSIDREINEDRARMVSTTPVWRRYRLDLALLLVVAGTTAVAVVTSAFDGMPGSVYVGRSVQLPLWLLLLPLGAWLGGCLVAGRGFARLLGRRSSRSTVAFDRPVPALVRLSLRRRAWAVAEAAVVVSLIVALGVSLAVFTASYDSAKEADARFVLGGDLRITPSPSADRSAPVVTAADLEGGGVDAAAPVVFGVHNAVVRSHRTEELASVAAVDPDAYGAVAPVQDADFAAGSARGRLALLRDDPTGVLLSERLADFLQADVGDPLSVLLARATPDQVETDVTVVGLFERLPGFPDGVDVLMNLEQHRAMVPSAAPTFFLARTTAGAGAELDRVVADLHDGAVALQVDSRTTVLARDQSSLAALNIRGLLDLDTAYALAMSTVTIAIFVFGLLLQRRREYVTLRAQGLPQRSVRALITAEAVTVAAAGCLAGVVVGGAMAYFFVRVLRPLFVLSPSFRVPLGATATVLITVIAATVLASLAGSLLVNRLRATELLRDE